MSGRVNESFLGRATPLVVARMLSAGLTFCIPLVLARTMALEEFGTYKQLLLVAQTLYYLLPFGLAQSLYFFFPRGEHRRAYLAQTLLVLTGVGLLGFVVLALWGEGVADYFSNPAFLSYRWPLGLYVLGVIVSSPLEVALTGEGRTRAAAVTYLVSDGLRTLAMVVPIVLGQGLWGLMSGLALFSMGRALVTLLWVFRYRGAWWQPGLLKGQLRYTAPFGAAIAINVPQVYAHQFAVSGVVTPEEYAIYAVACFQLPLIHLLYTPVSEVLMVRLGELDREGRLAEAAACFREAVSRLCYAFIPLAVFSFVAAPELVSAFFGERYLSAVPLFRIGVWAMVLASFPVDGALRATGHTGHIFRVSVLKAVLTFPLVYGAVHALGMTGGMLSSLTADLVAVSLLLVGAPRALRLSGLRELLPWGELGKAALAAGGAALGVMLVRLGTSGMFRGMPQPLWVRALPLVVAGFAFGAAYLLMLRLVGVDPFRLRRALASP